MNTVKLNIGLENNPYTFFGVECTVRIHLEGMINESREEIGEYDGNPERTVVMDVTSPKGIKSILKSIENLTIIFTQDCIAVKINDVGYLVYHPEYKGEKFEFNNEYFIEP